jgi:hypothetical protein
MFGMSVLAFMVSAHFTKESLRLFQMSGLALNADDESVDGFRLPELLNEDRETRVRRDPTGYGRIFAGGERRNDNRIDRRFI